MSDQGQPNIFLLFLFAHIGTNSTPTGTELDTFLARVNCTSADDGLFVWWHNNFEMFLF